MSGWGRINGNAFRAQVSLDLSRAFDSLNATVPERIVLGYIREQSWNRSILRKGKASDPWPDPLPASIDLEFLAAHVDIAPRALGNALDSLRRDKVVIAYKGGLTVNKHVDEWAPKRISRAALEYARSAQAVPHPGPKGSSYPNLCRPPTELPPNPDDPAGYLADWMRQTYGRALPVERIAELVETGHHVVWIAEAIRKAMDSATVRSSFGIAGYAAKCLADWKAKGRTRSAPDNFDAGMLAARSPPSVPAQRRSKKEDMIAASFAEAAKVQEQDDGDDDEGEEEAPDGGAAGREDRELVPEVQGGTPRPMLSE